MGTAQKTTVTLKIEIVETGSGDLVSPKGVHVFPPQGSQELEYATGTSNSQIDRVWSDTRSAAAAVDDLDLRGGLTSAVDGATLNFAEVCIIAIRNKHASASLTVGVAGANPFISWLAASGDGIVIPAGTTVIISNPVGGFAAGAAASDVFRIDPGVATIEYDILIAGRSA